MLIFTNIYNNYNRSQLIVSQCVFTNVTTNITITMK